MALAFSPAPGQASQAPENRIASAVFAQRAPRLDGTLNDPLWQSAKPIDDFRQREPYEGQPATRKTEVRILYTKNAVFFGIHCYDSEPSGGSYIGVMGIDKRSGNTTGPIQSSQYLRR